MNQVSLFGLARSVYTRIARLALEEKGVPYDIREVEIFGPDGVPAVHLLRHPFGRIPVLSDRDFELYETSAITRYVDETFAGPSLQPRDARARARMNQIIGLLDSYAYRPMVWGVFVQRFKVNFSAGVTNKREVTDALLSARTCLLALERLAGFSPFLLGQDITLADLHAFPILRYLSLVAEGRELLAEHPLVEGWLEQLCVRPSVLRTCGPYELAAQYGAVRVRDRPGVDGSVDLK